MAPLVRWYSSVARGGDRSGYLLFFLLSWIRLYGRVSFVLGMAL
jgi:hypothetical protein